MPKTWKDLVRDSLQRMDEDLRKKSEAAIAADDERAAFEAASEQVRREIARAKKVGEA